MISGVTPITKFIFYVNVIVFLLSLMIGDFILPNFAMFNPTSEYFKIWQPITHMFLHGGLLHILFNMMVLVSFAPFCENYLSRNQFLSLYFLSGIVAAFSHVLIIGGNSPMVGASGAIFGILYFYIMSNPKSTLSLYFLFKMKAMNLGIGLFILELSLGIYSIYYPHNIGHFAHLGGALFGIGFFLVNKHYEK